MPHRVRLGFKGGENEPHRYVEADISDADWTALLNYRKYATDLRATEIVRAGAPCKLSLRFNAQTGMSYSTELPPDDSVLALFHRLRPFVLNDEPTNLYRVLNIIKRAFDDAGFRRFLDALKEFSSGRRMQAMILMKSNDVVINCDETLQKWLNAYEYHRDPDKQKEIDALHELFPLEASRAVFVSMMFDKARAILVVADLIGVISNEMQSLECRIE
jgi:hypothetical protein